MLQSLVPKGSGQVSSLRRHRTSPFTRANACICFFWCAKDSPDEQGGGRASSLRRDTEDAVECSVDDEYLFGRRLGIGGFSEVRHAIRRSDGRNVAVKMVRRFRLSADQEARVREEASVLRELRHPAVVQLKDFCTRPDGFYTVLELLDGGELLDGLAKREHYTEADARHVFAVLAGALSFVHGCGIVHRDLTADNVLLVSQHDLRVKITGWGGAKRLPPGGGLLPGGEHYGTQGYIAPEVLLEEPYGTPADLWALGVILHILLCGSPPFEGGTPHLTARCTLQASVHPPDLRGPAWEGVSPDARNLVGRLLDADHTARLTADGAGEHPWARGSEAQLDRRSLDAVIPKLRQSRLL